MIKIPIKFNDGSATVCIGGVSPEGELIPWTSIGDAERHIRYLRSKGYNLEIISVYIP